jgi:hypothetical protein
MKKYLNGKMVEMTAEELAEYIAERESNTEESEVTSEERIAALEAAMLEMAEVLFNG